MRIWIDGDACPNAIKTILFRAANRTQTESILVANKAVQIPASPYIKRWVVDAGFDVADNTIVSHVAKGDLVITADIPLADEVVTKGARALNPRGQLYTESNIKHILALRDFNTSLRETGQVTSHTRAISQKDIQQFSNHLDRLLTQAKKA